jgi:hypothetical protein
MTIRRSLTMQTIEADVNAIFAMAKAHLDKLGTPI